MVIGNSMTAVAVALNRLADEMHDGRRQIEAMLALGATSFQAARAPGRAQPALGMIPLVDSTKTTGIVFFPGTMVGMLIAGAEPVDAVRLQLVLLWVLLGAVALAGLIAVRSATGASSPTPTSFARLPERVRIWIDMTAPAHVLVFRPDHRGPARSAATT